ncbi:hypothetical protein JCM24511_06872 [Saitozyma sp. JCM 24511]|nr:hypothetical protein JCM24511_06872 [Saitozyma sp. JCM 24511]
MSSEPPTNLPLPQFYARTLTSLLPLFNDVLSPSSPGAQDLLRTALDELYLIARMIVSLGVFSENESAEELGDGELVFMTLGWVIGEAEAKAGLGGMEDRKGALQRSDTALQQFLALIRSYKVLSSEEEAESSNMADQGSAPRDPAKRREAKIRQYKREKELRDRIASLAPDHPPASSSPITFILSLLPSSSRPALVSLSVGTGTTSGPVASDEDAPHKRELALLLLRLLHTLALSTLSSTAMELSLLAEAPSRPAESSEARDNRTDRREEDDQTWRLERQPGNYKPRELISGGGRVLRPFTIMPSTTSMSDRERLRSEVFRSSHRLPSMTIDEYLEEEKRRGNIITGGGQASYDKLTESELLELATEDDGTMAAEAADEKQRRKQEDWAVYTEANQKGAGNTLNRG